MSRFVNCLGRNHWLIIVELFPILSLFIYGKALTTNSYLQTQIIPFIVVGVFAANNIFSITLKKHLIFRDMHNGFTKNPQLHPKWKLWFLVIHIPYLIYSIWFGLFLKQNEMFSGTIFATGMFLFLACAYLRLSASE